MLQANKVTPMYSIGFEKIMPTAIRIGPIISMATIHGYQLFFAMIRPSIPIKIGTIADEK
ncbi:hypothetical protein L3i20_v216580 [Paenibacillus sp. L3-i20]|nr:hypothetical protein L3i20_v216580 [Paenibacillus sp. L3-i20]